MSWLQFFASLAGSLAWPASAVLIALVFKGHLAKLLQRMRSAKGFGAEATFEGSLEKAEATVEANLPDIVPSEVQAQPGDDGIPTDGMFNRLVGVSPSAAIVMRWLEVEDELRRRHASSTVSYNSEWRSFSKSLSPTQMEVFRELRSLRNLAAHEGDKIVTIDQAHRFNRLSEQLLASQIT